MLKVNVGLSRKLCRDYNSTGFSVNLEGEITCAANDSDGVIEQVKQLFDLAEEALDQQVSRTQSIDAQANHEEEPRQQAPGSHHRVNGHSNGHQVSERRSQDERRDEQATNKQVQYLLSIGKRQRLSTIQLEHQVREILQKQIGIYDLSKREAAQVIDTLTSSHASGRQNSRY